MKRAIRSPGVRLSDRLPASKRRLRPALEPGQGGAQPGPGQANGRSILVAAALADDAGEPRARRRELVLVQMRIANAHLDAGVGRLELGWSAGQECLVGLYRTVRAGSAPGEVVVTDKELKPVVARALVDQLFRQ